jgi:hypothetical protein
MNWHLLTEQATLWVLLGWLEVANTNVHTLHNDAIFIRDHPKNLAYFSTIITSRHND